ncbi:hypothetical protein [Endobacterium cereale]|uniref:hypothetical protein n=1 Tax=Endobacterium cereale TaxID=2663029 RepID=UPI002B49186D|nr:hypothetical protein [Endobacterium cereale]MEB2845945.1 hypothetical protein [Endobacterium cereale]
MTGSEIMAVVGFFVMVSGALWGIWWRIEGKVKEAKDAAVGTATAAQALANLSRDELAAHRLHVAETYITKAGMRETTEQLMEAISGVKSAVDGMTLRIDRVVEGQPRRATRAS